MSILTYALIALYAVLTGLAGFAQWREKGIQARTLLFIIISISLLAALWIPNKMIMFGIVVLIFVVLHVLTALEGLRSNGKLQYRHHSIRLVFHLAVIFLVFQFIL